MNLSFMNSRWFLLFVAIILPALLLVLAMVFNSNICIIFAIVTWLGLALMLFYLPKFKD